MKKIRPVTRPGRSWPVSLAALATVALLAAACGSSPSTTGQSGTADQEPTATIVAIAATSGEFAQYGINYERGALLGARYAAAHHIANITVKQENSQDDPGTGVTIVRNIIAAGYRLIVDYGQYQVLVASAPVAERAQALTLAGTKESSITSVGPWIWQGPDGSTALASQNLITVLRSLHAKTIAIAVDNDSEGTTGAAQIQKDARAVGITVKTVQEWDPTATDFTPQINNIIHAHVDAVASFSVVATGALFIKQARAAGLDVPMIDGSGWDLAEFFQIAGDSVSNVYCITDFVPGQSRPVARYLDQTYQADYGSLPNNDVAAGFDAVVVMAEAMRLARSSSPNAVRMALAKVHVDGAEANDLYFSSARTVVKTTLAVTAKGGQWVEWDG